MKLLREAVQEVFFDKESPDKRLYIEGIYMQGEIVNANGRKYPIEVLEKACDIYTREKIQTGRSLGELNHPDSPDIDFERAAIRTISLRREGESINGKALVLNSAKGRCIEGLIRDGVTVAVSSRGLASVDKIGGIEVVQEDFHICAAADVVYDPSAPDAFVTPIMENKEWYIENGAYLARPINMAEKMIRSARGKSQIDEAIKIAARLFSESIRKSS